jgi:hypothetical protein
MVGASPRKNNEEQDKLSLRSEFITINFSRRVVMWPCPTLQLDQVYLLFLALMLDRSREEINSSICFIEGSHTMLPPLFLFRMKSSIEVPSHKKVIDCIHTLES